MPDAAAKSDSDKIHYVKSDSITSLLGALDGTLGELSITPFNDVVVTDYMSKWVNLDASTLKIVDNTTGEAIWQQKVSCSKKLKYPTRAHTRGILTRFLLFP